MGRRCPNLEEIANNLLWPLWRGASDAYKAKYARTIWVQFEERVRSSAYTSSVSKFIEAFGRKMQVEIRKDDLSVINTCVSEYEEHATLSALRNETTALVLMVRLKNEERKAEYQAKARERREEQALDEDLFSEGPSDGPLFDLA